LTDATNDSIVDLGLGFAVDEPDEKTVLTVQGKESMYSKAVFC